MLEMVLIMVSVTRQAIIFCTTQQSGDAKQLMNKD